MIKLIILLSFSFLFYHNLYSQAWVSYDFQSGKLDTLDFISSDIPLPVYKIPDGSVRLDTVDLSKDFIDKVPVSEIIGSYNYPLSTTVRLVHEGIDGDKPFCSGFMVGSKYVASASHCSVNNNSPYDLIRTESVRIEPAYDLGKINLIYGYANVRKVYCYIGEHPIRRDLMIYELDSEIGFETGWLNLIVGDSSLNNTLAYKLSYPMIKEAWHDVDYNGDTLYYTKTRLLKDQNRWRSTHNIQASRGESGSTLISLDTINNQYNSIGILSFGAWLHYALAPDDIKWYSGIINILSGVESHDFDKDLTVYPNPTRSITSIKPANSNTVYKVYDFKGQFILEVNGISFDASKLSSGMYYIVDDNGNSEPFQVLN
jgi:hypothetical protein